MTICSMGETTSLASLKKDSIGQSYCKSIFFDADRNSGDFRRIFSADQSVVAFSPYTMLLYSGEATDTVYFAERMQTAFCMGNRLIVQSDRGELFDYESGRLKSIEIPGIESQSRIEKTILDGKFLIAENEIFKATAYVWQR